jgi:phosphoglycolate phosphatase-like HAD superfamily hydrolase
MVLDFDGVLCDSQNEVMSAGLECAREKWPEAFEGVDVGPLASCLPSVRPRLIKGYESMLMARVIAEQGLDQGVDSILACDDWSERVKELLRDFEEEEAELEAGFESWRMDRVRKNFDSWVSLNPLYDGVYDALMDCPSPYYIATSKSSKRVFPLLREQLGLDLEDDSPRVFHSLIPPNELKLNVLKDVMARPVASDPRTQLHFVDDRWETLRYVLDHADEMLLERYNLYLASHGYCTNEEIEEAEAEKGVRVIDLDGLNELLRFGIVMKVNDGCQDTEEEARANVYDPRPE